MATPHTEITLIQLELLAYNYIEDCMNFKKEHPTASGRLVQINDRQIPTIDYFLRIWIPMRGKPTINRSTYYRWLNDIDNEEKCNTIKSIEGIFKALATDIVANEGKGIFYAKNRLGMTDKALNELKLNDNTKLPEWLIGPIVPE
jgi:hypothetical protein